MNQPIANSVDIPIMNIYKHFKGKYFVVLSIANIEGAEIEEPQVVYQSLSDGNIWIRSLVEFNEDIGEREDNVTGQAKRFERVENFDNPLSTASTDSLIAELMRREDNPFVGIIQTPKTFDIDYIVGRPVSVPCSRQTSSDRTHVVQPIAVYDTEEEAIKYQLDKPHLTVFKRVLLKVNSGFDSE